MNPKGYTNKQAIENYLLIEIDDSFNSQVDAWMASIERIIDNYTSRNFKADSTASARVYDGDGTNELIVDECIEVTKVEVGNSSYGDSFAEVSSTGADKYFTYPANATARMVPIHKISLSARCFPSGYQNNRVTAKWGYSITPPEDITFAATVFVAGVINQSRGGGDEIKSESIGSYSVTYNSDKGSNSWADFERAKQILDQYKRINI